MASVTPISAPFYQSHVSLLELVIFGNRLFQSWLLQRYIQLSGIDTY